MAAKKQISARVAVQSFGQAEDGQEILKYTLKNQTGQEVDVISYGATIVGARTPDRNGKFEDVVLGFDNIYGKEKNNNFLFFQQKKLQEKLNKIIVVMIFLIVL